MKTTYVALIEEISEELNIDKRVVRKTMDKFIEKVKKLKHPGDTIYLYKLGKFTITERKSKVVKLNNKEEVIPPMKILTFKRTHHRKVD